MWISKNVWRTISDEFTFGRCRTVCQDFGAVLVFLKAMPPECTTDIFIRHCMAAHIFVSASQNVSWRSRTIVLSSCALCGRRKQHTFIGACHGLVTNTGIPKLAATSVSFL